MHAEDAFGTLIDAVDNLDTFHDVIGTADRIWDYLEVEGYVIVRDNKRKLGPSDVRAMRMNYKAGKSQRELADFYGVNPATVSRIVRGEYW